MSKFQQLVIRGRLWILRMGSGLPVPVETLRRASGQSASYTPNLPGIDWEAVDLNGLRGEWYIPSSAPTDAVLLYLHGGGFILGVTSSTRWLAGQLALASHIRTLLVDYSLAPEHPYPAGLEDCLTTYRWLLSKGFSAERIMILGDSAGGHLMLSLLLRLRDANLPLPAGAVGLSPATDPSCSGKSMRANTLHDALLSPRFTRRAWRSYSGDHSLNDPYLSLLRADLRGLPPLLIQVGGDEILLDDSRRFAECARAAGVDLTFEVYPHMWHVFQYSVPAVPEANQALEQIARFVQDRIGLDLVPFTR